MSRTCGPNILWIGTDEHHRGTIGAYGSPDCRTPHIDALARDSMVFEQAFSPMAVCGPARASMLTGRLPSQGSIVSNDYMEFTLPYREVGDAKPLASWAPAMRRADYRMVHVGKWHVSPDCRPSDYGFEGPDWPGYGQEWREEDFHEYRRGLGLSPEPELADEMLARHPLGSPFDPIAARLVGTEEGSLPAFVAHTGIQYLRELAERYKKHRKPFFLRCEWWGPHIRCIVPEPYYSMYDPERLHLPETFGRLGHNKPTVQRNFSGGWGIATHPQAQQREFVGRYYGYVTCIDAQIGRILKALDELGLREETLVIFTTDHGDMLGAHALYDKGPFMYDDIYRVPLMIRWPGMVRPGRNGALVYNMDLAATMWDVTQAKPPKRIASRSLLPLLRRERNDLGRDLIFCEHYRQWDFYSQAMLHSGTDKFIYNFGDVDEYYDLQADPHEITNRIDDASARHRICELRTRMHEQLKRVDSPMLHGFERTLAAKMGGKTCGGEPL